MGDRTAPVRGRWLVAALVLTGCGGPIVSTAGGAADPTDPVDHWQQVVRANVARYVCYASPRDARQAINFAHALVDARTMAVAALARRANVPETDPGVLNDIDRRRAEQDRAVRDVVAQRGCGDPQITDLLGLADRLSD